jgi:hypothetical protein
MVDRDPATVLDLVLAGRSIQEFLADQDFETFQTDLKTGVWTLMRCGRPPSGTSLISCRSLSRCSPRNRAKGSRVLG